MDSILEVTEEWTLGDDDVRVGLADYGCFEELDVTDGLGEEIKDEIEDRYGCALAPSNDYSLSRVFQDLNSSSLSHHFVDPKRPGVPFAYIIFSATSDELDVNMADSSVLCADPSECRILVIKMKGAVDLSRISVPPNTIAELDSSDIADFLKKNICADF